MPESTLRYEVRLPAPYYEPSVFDNWYEEFVCECRDEKTAEHIAAVLNRTPQAATDGD